MDLISEFKKKILCSKQLLDKCKFFQDFEKRYLDKGLDDFSSHVVDSIDLNLDIEDNVFTVSCLESDEELEQYTYYKIIESVIEKISCNLDIREYLTLIGLNSRILITAYLKFDIKYYYEENKFKLKSITDCKILKSLKSETTGFRIYSIEPASEKFEYQDIKIPASEEKIITLGYCKSEEKCFLILKELDEAKNYLIDLDKRIKEDLFQIFQFIKNGKKFEASNSLLELNSGDKKEDIDFVNSINKKLTDVNESLPQLLSKLNKILNTEYTSYEDFKSIDKNNIIYSWLDKNCKKELRNLIEINKYNYYLSNYDRWLTFVWFLEDNVIVNFAKINQSSN